METKTINIECLKELNKEFTLQLLSNQISKSDVCGYILSKLLPQTQKEATGLNYSDIANLIKKGYYAVKSLEPDFCITAEDLKNHVKNNLVENAKIQILYFLKW